MDLWGHLKVICQDQRSGLDLAQRLQRVRKSAEHIWGAQRLQWFSDHSVAHSDRIVTRLAEVLSYLIQTGQRLSPHELYILLAACYLHDIGMQDFRVEGRSVDQLTIRDYDLIRIRHPVRSRQLIIQRSMQLDRDSFRIDIDDEPQYTVPIALVSQGHGSAYFDTTVEELRAGSYRPGNQELRGDLLAALLLMGDELDLHEERARFPFDMNLSPTATLHNYVHHYVTGVEVLPGDVPKERCIHITFQYPSASEAYEGDVRWWVVNKLHRQMRRTASVIRGATQGELAWDERIHVREFVDRYDVRRQLPERAQLLLRRERLEATILNRHELVTKITEGISSTEPRLKREFIEVVGEDDSDWGHLSKWLSTMIKWCDAKLVHVSFEMSVGHGPLDLLERCYHQLVQQGISCGTYETTKSEPRTPRPEASKPLCDALLLDLEKQGVGSRIVLLFEQIDAAEPETREWLSQSFLRELADKHIPVMTIVTYRKRPKGLGYGHFFRLEPFSVEVLCTHLIDKLGYSQNRAKEKAEAMHTLSQGTPLPVLDYLHLEEEQQTIVKRE